MSGQLLREARHQCRPPFDDLGAVWRCECGRRWVCVLDYTVSPDGRASKRRLLPWPRPPRGNQEDPAETALWEAEKTPPPEHHCPGCRCGPSGNLTLHPSDVEIVTDGDGNPVAYLYNAQ